MKIKALKRGQEKKRKWKALKRDLEKKAGKLYLKYYSYKYEIPK